MEIVILLASKNNKPSPFNTEKTEAGKVWLRIFFTRYPELSFRKPENTRLLKRVVLTAGFKKEFDTKVYNFFLRQ